LTGLETKGRIRLTTAACLEQQVKEGGTLEEIGNVLGNLVENESETPIFDLNTGE
jgi:hypothetical protein